MTYSANTHTLSRDGNAIGAIALSGLLAAWLLGYTTSSWADQAVTPRAEATSAYAVQIGAFGDAANAERRLAMVESFIDGARIFSGRAGSEARFFVIAGIFADQVAARRQAERLKGFGIDTYIRPLSNDEAGIIAGPGGFAGSRTGRASATSSNETSRQNAVDFLQSLICRPPLCLPDKTSPSQARPQQ